MAMVIPEVALQRLIQIGIKNLRSNEEAFKCIFAQYLNEEMSSSYGQAYIDQIYTWFTTAKIPVTQAWSFDPTKVPSFTVELSDENEDESKAAISDFYGMGADSELLTGVETVSLDIGIHADKSKDHVLWLYYVLMYILYKEKPLGHKLGLQLYTFRASPYNKESKYMADNVWSRWVRFKCTVQNYIDGDTLVTPVVELDVDAESSGGGDIVDIYADTIGDE